MGYVGTRYTEEFKREAVAQVTTRGHSVTSVAKRIGVSSKSMYDWVNLFGGAPDTRVADAQEIKRLKYAFIKAHRAEFSVRAMCRV